MMKIYETAIAAVCPIHGPQWVEVMVIDGQTAPTSRKPYCQQPKGDDGLYFFTSTNHDFQNVVYGVRQLRCEERLIACLASGAEVIKFMGQP